MIRAFAAYQAEYARLDSLGNSEPARVRIPAGARPAVVARIRKNYALDRARYFIPLATRTNLALVQTARMWAQTVKHLDSLPQPEARAAAAAIRDELIKLSPRLMRHSGAESSYQEQAQQELTASLRSGSTDFSAEPLADAVWVKVDREIPPWLPETQPSPRRCPTGPTATGSVDRRIRRMRVTFAWNNLAIAELRDSQPPPDRPSPHSVDPGRFLSSARSPPWRPTPR